MGTLFAKRIICKETALRSVARAVRWIGDKYKFTGRVILGCAEAIARGNTSGRWRARNLVLPNPLSISCFRNATAKRQKPSRANAIPIGSAGAAYQEHSVFRVINSSGAV